MTGRDAGGSAPRREPAGSPHLGRQSLLTAIALVVNGVSRLASSLVVGRGAGAVSLGLFQSGLASAQLAALVGPAAVGSAASAFVARTSAQDETAAVDEVHAHLLLRTLQTTVPVGLFSGLGWWWLHDHDLVSSAAFVVLTTSFCLYSFSRGVMYGAGRGSRAAVWNIVTATLGSVVLGACVALGLRGGVLLAVFSLGYLVFAAVNWVPVRPGRLRSPLGREIDRFVLFGVLGTLASGGFLNATMVVTAAVGSPQEVAQFSAAFALSIPASLVGAAGSLVLFPALSRLFDQRHHATRIRVINISHRSLTVVAIAMFSPLILLRHEVVHLLWGSQFSGAAELLTPLLFALLLTTLAIPSVNALTALSDRGVRQSALSSTAGLATGVTAWAVLVPVHGSAGVAYGFLIGSVVSSAVPYGLTWRRTGQSWSRHCACLVTALGVLAVLSILQQQLRPGTATNLGLLGVYTVAWLALVRTDVIALLNLAKRTVTSR